MNKKQRLKNRQNAQMLERVARQRILATHTCEANLSQHSRKQND